MWYITPVADDAAEGILRELYNQDLQGDGYVSNTSRVWSYRPEVAEQWILLLRTVRSHMRLRAYELVTLAASRAIGCVFWMLAHGAVLRKNGVSAEQVIAILQDYQQAGLSPVEEHMMDYAAKISANPPAVTQADVERLRADGLTDQQITDIALAAVARNFISRFYEALGASPDLELQQQEPELWGYLKDWKARA